MLEILHFLNGVLFTLLEVLRDLLVLSFFNLDLSLLVFILVLFFFDFTQFEGIVLLEVVFFDVELVLKSQEVLVERNVVSQENFVTLSLIFLLDFTLLKALKLTLHQCNLFVKIVDVLLLVLVR